MRAFQWTYAIFFEVLTILSFIFARIFQLGVKDVSGLESGRPILLVHGYITGPTVWHYQRRKLKGLGPIYIVNLGHPFRSIRHYAEKVKEKAAMIAKETGRSDLALVGHSMGGLVSSYYAANLAPHTVTDVITIASPFAGTAMARLAIGPNAREMEPNSEFLKELKSKMKSREQIRFSHIATKCDMLVLPGESAVIEGNPHIVFEDLGHGSLLYSRRVTGAIREWLAAP